MDLFIWGCGMLLINYVMRMNIIRIIMLISIRMCLCFWMNDWVSLDCGI